MKFKILICLLLCFMISCKSNYTKVGAKNANYIPYYLKIYEADSLYIVGNYKQSNHILDSLFKKFEPLHQQSYGEYVTYLKNKILLNDLKNTDKILKSAIQDYGYKVEYCVKDSLIKKVIKNANFKESDLNGFYDNYVKGLNLEYRHAIEKMVENDQRVRLATPRNVEEWEKVDKENAEQIRKLIVKLGYPSTQKIGRYDLNNKRSEVSILFLHATKEAREDYILELLLGSVKKGECEPHDFASNYDKYLRVSGIYDAKVLYGELRSPRESLEMQVINPKKIDSIRKSIGLENIEYRKWKLKKLTGINIDND